MLEEITEIRGTLIELSIDSPDLKRINPQKKPVSIIYSTPAGIYINSKNGISYERQEEAMYEDFDTKEEAITRLIELLEAHNMLKPSSQVSAQTTFA